MIGITVRAEVITCVKQSANTYLAPQYYASSAAEKLNFMSPFASGPARGRGDLGQRGSKSRSPSICTCGRVLYAGGGCCQS